MAGIRRTWDKELYAAKAKERLEKGDEDDTVLSLSNKPKQPANTVREEFQPAADGAAGPMGSERAFLKARENKVDVVEKKVGKIEVIKPGDTNAVGPGFWCEVCKCLLKDSNSYFDHINGKKHQHALGFSMRVEKVDADTIKAKLEALKKRKIDSTTQGPIVRPSAAVEHDAKIATQLLEEELARKKRKEETELRRKEKEALELEQADPEISELMGFGGFGGSKKR